MNCQCGKQIRDKKVIAAGGVGAIVFLLSLLLLIYAGQQRLAGTGEIPFQGIWFVLLVCTLVSIPLILFVLATLFCRELTKRKLAEEQLAEFQERLRSLTSQLSLAEERERRRIAVYLHDNIGQKLAISSIKLGQLKDDALAAESEPLVAGSERNPPVV